MVRRFDSFSKTPAQAPWRKQAQIAGLVLVIVIFITLFSAVYLHISARTAEVGRQIQVMQNDIEELDRQIEDMKAQLAVIESSGEMDKRAGAAGFKPVSIDEITFLKVPGYVEPPAFVPKPSSELQETPKERLPFEYTESLFDWLGRKIALYLAVR